MNKLIIVFFTAALLSGSFSARAESALSIADPFGDGMVLQQGMAVPVWGEAGAGAKVSVTFAGQTQTTTADSAGQWKVTFTALPASAESRVMRIESGTTNLEIKDVLVGEVWLCSGQSNMRRGVLHCADGQNEVDGANDRGLRLRATKCLAAEIPQRKLFASPWLPCTSNNICQFPSPMKGIPGSFSATAYYFGRQLRRELNVPVGLIQSALGGTAIAPWQVPQEIVQVAKGHSGVHIGMPGRQPPHALYNAMIAPWTGYAIRGAIWYQGESDCNPKGLPLYLDNMKTLVKGWRDVWGRSEESFPFYFVQLAPYGYEPRALRYPSGALPRMWAAQLDAAQAISNAAMAHTQDIGDLNNIHPANKQDVGARLARLALSRTYHVKTQAGRPITDDSGPEFKGMEVKGNRMVVSFNNAKSGLTTRDGRPPALFEVAGEDGKFEPAAATLAGETVVLTSDKVATPSQVRFGWSNVAEPNLMNGDKLPAASFRAGQGK